MSNEDIYAAERLLASIKEDITRKTELEAKIRKVLYGLLTTLLVFFVITYGNQRVLQDNVEQQGRHIDVLRKNAITYETFVLWNRTYELQLEETQAALQGDMERVMQIQGKYRELRGMIVQQRPSTSRGSGGSVEGSL